MNIHTRKMVVAVVAIVALTVLLMAERIDEVAGLSALSGITFYILGNGIAAVAGKPVKPVIEPRPERFRRRATDHAT